MDEGTAHVGHGTGRRRGHERSATEKRESGRCNCSDRKRKSGVGESATMSASSSSAMATALPRISIHSKSLPGVPYAASVTVLDRQMLVHVAAVDNANPALGRDWACAMPAGVRRTRRCVLPQIPRLTVRCARLRRLCSERATATIRWELHRGSVIVLSHSIPPSCD
jgi:hypothetical protein